jgi:ATP-dependent Clp protease ATP-binding subunit ClpA
MNWFKAFWKWLSTPASAGPGTEPADLAFSNFTPRAQQLLDLARKEAERLNHHFAGTEHLLLGLTKLGQGVSVNVLSKLGVNFETVRAEVEKCVGTGPGPSITGRILFTPRVMKVLDLARKEARALSHTYVGTEHILLGLLHDGEGVAGRILANLGVNIEKTRQEILKELDPNFVEPGPPPSTPDPEQPKPAPSQTPGEHQPLPADDFSRNFTPRAQQVLALARKEAERLNHNFVGTEHLLLGMIALGQGTAVAVLKKMGVDLERTRDEVKKQVGTGPAGKLIGIIPYTPRTRKVLELAAREARSLNHTCIGTEHILLGLLREGAGVAARILKQMNVDLAQTRQEVLKKLDPNPALLGEMFGATSTVKPKPAPPPPLAESVDISKRYDVYCTDWSQGVTVYRNVRFKGIKHLFQKSAYDALSWYVELEQENGQIVNVSRSSIIRFTEPGA